jgi:hypothetical protein
MSLEDYFPFGNQPLSKAQVPSTHGFIPSSIFQKLIPSKFQNSLGAIEFIDYDDYDKFKLLIWLRFALFATAVEDASEISWFRDGFDAIAFSLPA